MKVIIVGCGNVGPVAAEDIAVSMSSTQVVVADKDEKRAKTVGRKIVRDNVSWMQLDAANYEELVSVLKEFDLAMGFLPGNFGYLLARGCIDAQKDLVDVSYMAEDPLRLDSQAAEAGSTIVPDCGLAPGITNILAGHSATKLDRVEAVHIMVGGLPDKPVPPLDYIITWSPESLIDEYTRAAKIIRQGRQIEVEALSGMQTIEFPNIGKLEAFYTDGLRTLVSTLGHVDDMWEKTLRYPGHAEKIRLLRSLGFFDKAALSIQNTKIQPRKVTAKLFQQRLSKKRQKDIVALKVETSGTKNGKKMKYIYHMLDRYDKKQNHTAMGRTTGYTASIIAQLILKKSLEEKGVVPPEKIGMNEELFKLFLKALEKRGIKISEERIYGRV
jgi:lysine 6-dehydrogenase